MISNPASAPLCIGGRLGLRNAVRQILIVLHGLSPDDALALGWEPMEVKILEHLATMPIQGVAFGNWPER